MKHLSSTHSAVLVLTLGLTGTVLVGCYRSQPAQPVLIPTAPISPLPSHSEPATATPVVSTPPKSPPIPPPTPVSQADAHIPPGELGGPDPSKTAPIGIRAAIGDGQVALGWNSSGAESYNLYRGEAPNQEAAAPIKTLINSTPFIDKGLINGRTYYYEVTGVIGGKESPRSAAFPATPHTAPPPPKTRLTQAQALTRAAMFCHALGIFSYPGQAIFPMGASRFPEIHYFSPRSDTYFQPRWDVRSSNAQMEVVDATGIVTKYFAFGSKDQHSAGKAISRSQALARAAMVVRSTGLMETLGQPEVQEMQITSPSTRSGHLYNIVYPRQAQGHPIHSQQVTVMLQAESGALQALGVTFRTPPPALATPQVTLPSAESAAEKSLRKAQGPGFIFSRARLEWVQPMDQQSSGSRGLSDLLRLAWNCGFSEKNRAYAQVWVDAQTGQIIGGDMAAI